MGIGHFNVNSFLYGIVRRLNRYPLHYVFWYFAHGPNTDQSLSKFRFLWSQSLNFKIHKNIYTFKNCWEWVFHTKGLVNKGALYLRYANQFIFWIFFLLHWHILYWIEGGNGCHYQTCRVFLLGKRLKALKGYLVDFCVCCVDEDQISWAQCLQESWTCDEYQKDSNTTMMKQFPKKHPPFIQLYSTTN